MSEKKMPVEVYSRVVGYFRPLDSWNLGMKEQFKDRKEIPANKIKEFINEDKNK